MPRGGTLDGRLVLASLSGQSDAEWAANAADVADLAVLGGIAIDEAAREGARAMVERDRTEFLPPDPIAFVDEQLKALEEVPIAAGFNVRTTTLDPLARVASVCADHDAMVEVNAHCRQDELCNLGVGQQLLADHERLCRQVETAASEGPRVSVKVRAEVPGVDLVAVADTIEAAGADVIHIDAMDSEHVVADVADATDLTIIANNGIRDRETVFEYLDYGADAVSVGRPSDNLTVLRRVRAALDEWFADDSPPEGDWSTATTTRGEFE